jgi:DNA-binding response OmpR family regulator
MELIEFDLVVLDVMMPGESGLELTSWVRSKAQLSKTPVLLLTARGEASDRIDGLSRGADDYMSKPFDPQGAVAARRRHPAPHRRQAADAARDQAGPACSTWSGWS